MATEVLAQTGKGESKVIQLLPGDAHVSSTKPTIVVLVRPDQSDVYVHSPSKGILSLSTPKTGMSIEKVSNGLGEKTLRGHAVLESGDRFTVKCNNGDTLRITHR